MAWIWHHLTAGCLQFSRNISKEFNSRVMKMFTLLWENDFENSLKLSTATGLKNLFTAAGTVSTKLIVRGKIWYRHQIHILSYIWFHVLDILSGCKDTIWRHNFMNTLCMIVQMYSWNKLPVWYSICRISYYILKVKKIHINRLLTIDVSLMGVSLLG